jgi:hypothetical protein
MSVQNIEVSIAGGETGKGILHVLEGQLPDPENRKPISINGNINAPSEFWKKRKEDLLKQDDLSSVNGTNYSLSVCRVEFDHKVQTITLIVDEGSQRQITVNGSFVVNPIFDKLNINKPESAYESQHDLYKAIKFNGFIFKDKAQHAEILHSLKNFSAKVTKNFKDFDDLKGNSNKSIEVLMDGLPTLDFDIFTPIFSGEAKSELRVTVEVSERNGKPIFYLTCLELPQLSFEFIEQKFDELKADFETIAIIQR